MENVALVNPFHRIGQTGGTTGRSGVVEMEGAEEEMTRRADRLSDAWIAGLDG